MVGVVDIGSFSAAGSRYGSLNQDYAVAQTIAMPAAAPKKGAATFVGAVLDGHGILGEAASSRAGDALLRALQRDIHLACSPLSQLPDARVKSMLESAFKQGHDHAMSIYEAPPLEAHYPRNSGQPAKYTLHERDGVQWYRTNGMLPPMERQLECGTTCSLAVVEGDHLCLANVGDSAIVLGSIAGDQVKARVLTMQHSGFNHWEAERIRSDRSLDASIVPGDGYLAVTAGDLVGYQISVTRSLGHKHMAKHGVLPDPYVNRFKLEPADCCLLLASDGVFEVMGPDEAVNRVMDALTSGCSAQEAAQQLVTRAVDLALCGPGGDADNATAVVMALTHQAEA